MLTERSSRMRGLYPQIVAGRMVTQTKSADWCLNKSGSHKPLNLLYSVNGANGCSSVTLGASEYP